MEEKRVYETTYIVTPDLNQADYTGIVEKFNKILSDAGAIVSHQEIWGLKKLAYEINRRTSGYYVYTEFQTRNDVIGKLETEYQYDERIVRYLTVRLDKYSLDFAERRKAKVKGLTATIVPNRNAKRKAPARVQSQS